VSPALGSSIGALEHAAKKTAPAASHAVKGTRIIDLEG